MIYESQDQNVELLADGYNQQGRRKERKTKEREEVPMLAGGANEPKSCKPISYFFSWSFLGKHKSLNIMISKNKNKVRISFCP